MQVMSMTRRNFWPRRLRKLLPNLFLSSHLKPSLWSVSARGSLAGQALLSGEEVDLD